MKPLLSVLVLASTIATVNAAEAAKFTYLCGLSDPQFQPGLIFSYDDRRNDVQLIEAYGDVLRADQALGPVRSGDGFVEFTLEDIFEGYAEIRDIITYDTEERTIFISRSYLNKDGSLSSPGPIVEGKCIARNADETGAPATNFRTANPAPMTVKDAKIAIGFDPATAGYSFDTGASFKFGIADGSFTGIEAWLEDNPEFKSRVQYRNLRKSGKRSSGSHGFKVFKVAAEIMPSANFYLYETSNPVKRFKTILDGLKKDGVFFASMSLGVKQYMAGVNPATIYKQLDLLEEYQISFLVSAGNQRGDSHVFTYSDVDGDGKIEFSNAPKANGNLLDFNKISLGSGRTINLTLSWGEYPERQSDFEIQLIDKDKNVIASARAKGNLPVLNLRYKSPEKQTLWIKLLDKSETPPAPDLKFGMFVRNTNNKRAILNGQESMGIMAQYESPFLTVVGGFGKDSSGRLQPSNFSSIGHTNTGQIGPHILGPGQFLIDGKPLSGTSFATPFIAALYSTFADYNVKNVIEATATKEKLPAGLVPQEQGRWGTPDANKLLSNACTQSNKIENLRATKKADKLVVEFDFTRNCMEGLEYYLHAYVRGNKPVSAGMFAFDVLPVVGYPKQQLRGWVKKFSPNAKITAEPIRIEIPFKIIPRRQFGREVSLSFKISTRAQWDPVAIYADSPVLKVTLPAPQPLSGDVLVGKLAQKSNRAVEIQQFPDAIQLATLALKIPDLSAKDSALARNSRAMASIGLRDLAGLEAFVRDDIAAQPDSPIAALRLGDVLLSQRKFTEAQAQFKACLNSDGDDLYRCQIGYIVASQLAGRDARGEIAATYERKGAALADSPSVHGKALAVFLGHLGGGAYRDYFLAEARANIGKPEAARTISSSFYYLGLMGVWSDNMKFARDSFSQSAGSGAVQLEAALSNGWLDALPE
ncbi:MAG: hypothetical protein GXP03_06055 [Alphaproteobacteria bacterium]|nr:hypothetical protein [Alphaproteobacteria bacterium]